MNGLNWHLSSNHAVHRLDYTGLQLVSNLQILIQSPRPRNNPPCSVSDWLNLYLLQPIIMPTAGSHQLPATSQLSKEKTIILWPIGQVSID